MKQTDIKHRTIGVHFNSAGEAEVNVWAPRVMQLTLMNESTGTTTDLAEQEYGYWHTITDKLGPGDQYNFKIDGENAYPDPASLYQPNGVHNASKAVDLSLFKWEDADWQNIDLEKYITYELHTGTATPQGTFAQLESKLGYLVDLGITAIEIMPVAQFPGNRNWGYDGVYPFAVQNSYGGPAALQHLVNECHKVGLAVILDVVYNHFGPEGNYFENFGYYFTNRYCTPWGNAINFDDAWCDGVRHYFIENVLMWFRDFHIDALRLDAVHAIKDFSPVHILQQMKQAVDEMMQANGRLYYLIVEMDLNDTRYINPIKQGGYGMDAQWVDEFHHALRITAGGEKTGYYEDFNGLQHLAKSYRDAYVYDGMYSPHRKKHFGIKTMDNAGSQFFVFSQNHDQVGNRLLGERLSQLVSFEMQKLLAAAVICSPYLPMFFMGEEYAESNPFLYFVSHTDPELAKAVSDGRKKEFAAFHLEGEAPEPNAEETFLQSKLQWELLEKRPHATMLAWYKKLLALRKAEPALYNLNRNNVAVSCDTAKQLLVLRRWHDNDDFTCIMNFSKTPQTFAPSAESPSQIKIADSSASDWAGPGEVAPATFSCYPISIQPESIVVYKRYQA